MDSGAAPAPTSTVSSVHSNAPLGSETDEKRKKRKNAAGKDEEDAEDEGAPTSLSEHFYGSHFGSLFRREF